MGFGITNLFWMMSCIVEIPTAKMTASAFKLSFPQDTSVMHPVSSSKANSVTLLPSRNLQPWFFMESIHGSKIFSLTVPRHHTKSKFFCKHSKQWNMKKQKSVKIRSKMTRWWHKCSVFCVNSKVENKISRTCGNCKVSLFCQFQVKYSAWPKEFAKAELSSQFL